MSKNMQRESDRFEVAFTLDVKFWRLESILILKEIKMHIGHRPITYVYKWSGKS